MFEKLSIAAVYPEMLLAVMAIVIAMVDLFVKCPRRTTTYALSLLTIGVVAYMEAVAATQGQTVYSFGNMVVSDPMGSWLKCFAALAVMVTLVYGRPYAAERDMLRGGELFTLGLFALLGMFVMISGNNFLVLYLGLELLTLSSYALVALRRDNATASEAGISAKQQKLAVDTGYWPLFRYNPAVAAKGEPGLKLDSGAPKGDLARFMANETRFGILKNVAPERATELAAQAQAQVRSHYAYYQQLAAPAAPANGTPPAPVVPPPAAKN